MSLPTLWCIPTRGRGSGDWEQWSAERQRGIVHRLCLIRNNCRLLHRQLPGENLDLCLQWTWADSMQGPLCFSSTPFCRDGSSTGRSKSIHLKGIEPTLRDFSSSILGSDSNPNKAMEDHWIERKSHLTPSSSSTHSISMHLFIKVIAASTPWGKTWLHPCQIQPSYQMHWEHAVCIGTLPHKDTT